MSSQDQAPAVVTAPSPEDVGLHSLKPAPGSR